MASPWYLTAVLYMLFIIICLVGLVLVYWKAAAFIKNGSEGRAEEADVPDIAEEIFEKERTKTFRSMSQDAAEENIIADATLEVVIKYQEKNRYLSGLIENIKGLNNRSLQKNDFIRFHATLLPDKQDKFKTEYRSFKELNVNIAFGLNDLTVKDLGFVKVRMRMYARRFQYRIPLGLEKCIGEIYIDLSKYRKTLQDGKEVRTTYAILPKGNVFPESKPTDIQLLNVVKNE